MKALKSLILVISVSLFTVFGLLNSQDAYSQEAKDKGPKYGVGQDSVDCIMNISLYREDYKQWKQSGNEASMLAAIGPWRWVFQNCPLGTKNAYIDGEKIVYFLYKRETDAAKKDKIIDTLLRVFDQRIEYFGQEGYVLGRKAVAIMKYRKSDLEGIYKTFKKSVEVEKNKSKSAVVYYYIASTVKYVKAGKADSELVLETYDNISPIVVYNIKNAKNDKIKAAWGKSMDNIEKIIAPFATCEQIVKIFKPKFEATPNDTLLLKKVLKMLNKGKCVEEPLFADVTEKLIELAPSANVTFAYAQLMYRRKEWSKAATYFNIAIEIFSDVDDKNKKADAYLLLADCYKKLNKYSDSRTAAYSAAKLNPSDGRPYIIIGNLYMSHASGCGTDEISKKGAYWAAFDKYAKAKSVDSKVGKAANSGMGACQRQFPTTEDLFFHNIAIGSSHKVGCWINETTKVRAQ